MEADAKRLQTKEEELLKKKEIIKSHLTQLKKERKDLRTAVEAASGRKQLVLSCPLKSVFYPLIHINHLHLSGKPLHASLSEQLKKLEDKCKKKEDEWVNLELELTEVKESLKKALSGGVSLGLTIEPKAVSSNFQVRPQCSVVTLRFVCQRWCVESCCPEQEGGVHVCPRWGRRH